MARFQKHLESTHRSVGVTELTEAKQRQHESVDYFIAIWSNLELSCEQEFFEAQQVKMCINYFRYELSHILASKKILGILVLYDSGIGSTIKDCYRTTNEVCKDD